MRPRLLLILLACACTSAPPSPPAASSGSTTSVGRDADADRVVSVLELRNKLAREGSAIDAGYVADRLRAEVLGAGIGARVISRENMLVLLQAQGKQLADCEGECEVETGRRIGADLVVSGDLLRVGDSLKASLRLHDTRSGTLLAAATAAGISAEDLDAHLAPAMRQLFAAIKRPSAQTRAAPAFDARAFAASQASPFDCEAGARTLRDSSPDQAWSALAARGGDVEGDIPLVQKSRVPLFTLAAALRQPEMYRGRWVLVRGTLSEMRQDGARAAALMSETSLRATGAEVQVGPVSRFDRSSSSSSSGDAQASGYATTRGNVQGRGSSYSGSASTSAGARYSGSSQSTSSGRTEYSSVKQKFENERVETGRRALGRLAKADPFLETEKEFLFLARFDGMNPPGAQDQGPLALLSIAGYFRPNALLIQ